MKKCLVFALAAVALLSCSKDPDDVNNDLPGIDAGDGGTTQMDSGTDGATGDGGDDSRVREQEAILGVPETESITIGALEEPVQIVRTEADVPHVYAANEHDLYVALGWVLARDRYFEYEIAARLALGETSELLGRFGIGADVQSRAQGMHLVAERILEQMDEETGAKFDAFAEGINAYVDAVVAEQAAPPSEYVLAAPLLGGSPAELVSKSDRRKLAGFAAFVVFESSFTQNDLLRTVALQDLDDHFAGDPFEELRQGGVEDLLADTTPRHEIAASDGWGLNGTVTEPLSFVRPREVPALRPDLHLPAQMRERIRSRSANRSLWFNTPDPGDRGSNAWAVSSDQTADGSVLLAGDGHLALGIPTLFFQMGADLRTFSDDDPLRIMGLYLPGFPFLAVGTNGDIAWSQTYPRADVTDWYREEIQLDANGLPEASFFDGEWQTLEQVDEMYHVAGVLTDDPRDVVYPRWSTFDGRRLIDVEGRTVEDPETEELQPGESLVNMAGTWVVPGDVDGDGTVTGISFDYTGFDIGNLAKSVEAQQRATGVEEFQENTRTFAGYAQNLVVAEKGGKVGFTPYTAMPCREYLPRDGDGVWVEGANPMLVLDGTTYGAFEVPKNADGEPDPDAGGDDPQKCIVPWDAYPRTIKESGVVVNANNDPHGGSFDGTLANDIYYLGGPWVPGYRAAQISEELAEFSGQADVAAMAKIQEHACSRVGRDYASEAIRTIEAAKALQGQPDGDLTAAEVRARDLYAQAPVRLDETASRLQSWLDRGADAASGVETFYNQPTDESRGDAVATMIFNVWFRKWIAVVFDDENIRGLLTQPGRSRGAMMRALRSLTEGRGAGNPMNLASWNPDTEESIFFDDRTTDGPVESSVEMGVQAMLDALSFLEAEPEAGLVGGFGTTDMDRWLWGLRHRVVLDSILASFGAGNPAVDVIAKEFAIDTDVLPLADDISEGDPREFLRWFPQPGDYFGVDASNPSFYGDNFDYSAGPVMRMVIQIEPDGTVTGQNVIPGGQSGLNDSPHFADQAALWLGNDTVPLRWAPEDVAEGATGREVLTP